MVYGKSLISFYCLLIMPAKEWLLGWLFFGKNMNTVNENRLNVRLRRLRSQPRLRELVREVNVSVSDLVMPLFVKSGHAIRDEISSMPGQYHLSVDQLAPEIDAIAAAGIPAVMLFGLPAYKDQSGSSALQHDGVVQQAIHHIKQLDHDILVIADLCFCEYTDHGHCGVVEKNCFGALDVDNDRTLELLAEQAVSLAKSGADIIAPSGMMDGMVAVIRRALDANGYADIPILSYAVKYASHFYGPFRDAAEGAPQFGDRRTYQMDPANGRRALREAELDINEGADMLMVKPAGSYLDVVANVKQTFPALPLAAYQVSGEYSMIKAAAKLGWLDESAVMMESLLSIKRAGADFIITYFALDAARVLSSR